jgi:signal peptidase I
VRNLFRAAIVLVGVLAVALLLIGVTSKLYRIPSSAMEPTLHCPRGSQIPGCRGDEPDRILVSKVLYKVRDPERGDIVAYELPAAGAARCGSPEGSTFVHRIVGLPGERVALRGGRVLVNGRPLEEDYLEDGRRGQDTLRARVIPDDRYLVLGDNRTQSCDSRIWGFVPRSRIIGPKIATYWPEDRISIR